MSDNEQTSKIFSNSSDGFSQTKKNCLNNNNSLIHYESTSSQQTFSNQYFEELVNKYSLPYEINKMEPIDLNTKFEEIRNFLKSEIYKQYKLQEGAEKMKIATNDKKRISNLQLVIKESNNRIQELNDELVDLNSFIVVSQSDSKASLKGEV
jgi:hypothetical protein